METYADIVRVRIRVEMAYAHAREVEYEKAGDRANALYWHGYREGLGRALRFAGVHE